MYSTASIKSLIKTAFEPVGKVMYIYGGGWDEADCGAGTEAMAAGLSQSWLDFAAKQDSEYNYRDYNYKKDINAVHLGLDCSAYIGWVLHNVFDDGEKYVFKACKTGDMLAVIGYGSVTPAQNVKHRKTGDIMFGGCGFSHVYICIGECGDGSVLLLHSSPPGVQLSGTYTPNGNKKSQAVSLADEYMQKYYNEWHKKFPDSSRNTDYLHKYSKFEWSVLSDNEGYKNMPPRDVLRDVFEEI